MSGQINIGTGFGTAIYTIAKNPLYKTFCEVGTWNGLGSTRCIYEGIRNRNAILHSVEGDPAMYELAAQVWRNVPNVNLYYGTLHRNIMSRSEVETHPLYDRIKDHYTIHYDTESTTAEMTPLVVLPKCDVILLDGGEFSTQGDWETLYHPDLKVVILDDTAIIKTSGIRRQLLADARWQCTHDNQSDRNGWSIFKRI